MSMTELSGHVKIIMKISALKQSAISMKRLILSIKPTEHIPIHFFCKSYTCQKLDESCLNKLVKEEQKPKMSEISQRQPFLRSFIQ